MAKGLENVTRYYLHIWIYRHVRFFIKKTHWTPVLQIAWDCFNGINNWHSIKKNLHVCLLERRHNDANSENDTNLKTLKFLFIKFSTQPWLEMWSTSSVPNITWQCLLKSQEIEWLWTLKLKFSTFFFFICVNGLTVWSVMSHTLQLLLLNKLKLFQFFKHHSWNIHKDGKDCCNDRSVHHHKLSELDELVFCLFDELPFFSAFHDSLWCMLQ